MANDECYTPGKILRYVRRVMGGIDLDPASCDEANETVKATQIYTKDDSGLARRWAGRVWCNPPYSRGVVGAFCRKILREWESGDVEEMIVLLNAVTGTKYGQALMLSCQGCCFVAGRIAFRGEQLDGKSKGDQDSMILYFGTRPLAFFEVFCELGAVVVPSRVRQMDLFGEPI